ncbi:OmpA family protein [Pseudoalteromonas luteoviolacea]|uniref:OmpA family protein n=1 Tax=Pseudoalteromonas luteoviolacea TaxID=43657 RepID=UPI00115340A3|nr:OmpA family protein [Pseudoalteromonas luteoviolacea]TQF67554.1 OmpA family protein [Pseudoalteromonas luteoviolacea]
MLFENTELASDSEMGPGTDLVLSLLSVVITILAVVGMSYSVTDTVPSAETACQGDECFIDKKLASVETQLKDAHRQIESLTMELENLKAVSQQQPSIVYGKVLELHESTFAIFEKNQARVNNEDLQRLKAELQPLYENVVSDNANVIRIHGYASPEPRFSGADKSLDSNMDLSVDRSLAILHALYKLGVPYKCMVVEGYGRNRSRFLSNYLSQRDMTIKQWDTMYLQGFDDSLLPAEKERLLSQLEVMYQQDRRVDLIAAIEANSPCSPTQLASYLQTAIW